jgi:Tol biopolymer transport system component
VGSGDENIRSHKAKKIINIVTKKGILATIANYKFPVIAMNCYFRKIIFLYLSLVLLSGCLSKDYMPKPHSGNYNGKVVDYLTGEPVFGVSVQVGKYQAQTDRKGKFTITDLPPGFYDVKFTRTWYIEETVPIRYVGKADLYTYQLHSENLGGKILYSSNVSGKREIYQLDLLSRAVTKLTDADSSSKTNPARFSLNKIVFESDLNGKSNNDLFTYDILTKLTEPIGNSLTNDEHPSADRSGSKLVFQSMRNKKRQIFLYDPAVNSQPKIIASGQNPVINPDGTKIAFVDGSYKLWIYNLNLPTSGTNPRKINHPDKINNPCWSPDGTKIALESWKVTDGPKYIYYVEPDVSDNLQQVTFSYSSKDEHRHPCWSVADESVIFFTGSINYSSRVDIYCIRLKKDPSKQAAAEWLMVSKGSGDKDYPSWGE